MDTPTPTPEQQALADKKAQLRMSYGKTFSGVHGEAVLDDLKHMFWGTDGIERSSVAGNPSNEIVWNREGQKEVIRHILWRLLPPKDKQPNKK